MSYLSKARIFRGGVTASQLNYETSKCFFKSNPKDQSLDFEFEIASKGGGNTLIIMQIGLEDISLILDSIASNFPETGSKLSECASIANGKNLQRLQETFESIEKLKARAKLLAEDLIPVEEYIYDKYTEHPAGEESEIREKLDGVMRSLSIF